MDVFLSLNRTLKKDHNLRGTLAHQCRQFAARCSPELASRFLFVSRQLELPEHHRDKIPQDDLQMAFAHLLSVVAPPSKDASADLPLWWIRSLRVLRTLALALALLAFFIEFTDSGLLWFALFVVFLVLRPRLYPRLPRAAVFTLSLFFFIYLYVQGFYLPSLLLVASVPLFWWSLRL